MSHSVEVLELQRDKLFATVKDTGMKRFTIEITIPERVSIGGDDVKLIDDLTLNFAEDFQAILVGKYRKEDREEEDE
jgi:hypothetical protein